MSFRLLPPRQRALPALSEAQSAAAAVHTGTRVVLGGPGTGKSILVAEAAAARVKAGSSLERIVVLAHSRAAAQQLRREISRRLDSAQTSANVTTTHGLALGLLRRYWPHEEGQWELLRAPEQESRIRELLQGRPLELWPEAVHQAVGTRAFARQLREVMARVRQLALDPMELAAAATEIDDELFYGVASFLEEYLTVGDFEGSLDYSELVLRARLLLQDTDVADGVRAAYDAIIVDDAQEFDVGQVGLVGDLARLGIPVWAAGDPYQRIGGFRGASPDALVTLAGLPDAQTITLDWGFRSDDELARAHATLRFKMEARPSFKPPGPPTAGGVVAARVFDDESAELAHVAAELRHAATHDGVPWGQMAVVARSGRAQLSSIAKELIRLGVPVDVSGDEIALSEQSSVATLLLALRISVRPTGPEADEARLLLSSPLAQLDGVAQRKLGRALLGTHKHLGTSVMLLSRCLTEPALLEGLDTPEAESARQLAALLAGARELSDADAEVQEILWHLWDGTQWPGSLRESALRGSRRANAELDAVVELFELASRNDDLRGAAGVDTFVTEVEGQEIPADTGRELDLVGRGVRVVTAHRTRGLEWDRVWVVGVQEGLWPRLTRAGLMLDPARLSAEGLHDATTQVSQLQPERQLFYVACTRARHELRVSAVQGVDGEGGRPSRFLGELGVAVERIYGQPARPLSAASLVGELRRVLTDGEASAGLRRAAALQLAELAVQTTSEGSTSFPAAQPELWWGMHGSSSGAPAVADTIRITGSALDTLLECPRRWFLSRKAMGESARQSRASLGDVVHLIAREAATAGLSADEMHAKLDEIWTRIPFEAEWLSVSERSEIDAAVDRFATYHQATASDLIAVEQPFRVEMEVDGQKVELVGVVDRLERGADGRVRVVDLKTGRRLLKDKDVADNAQLGVYQLATQLGGFDDVAPNVSGVSAPALLMLRHGDGLPEMATQASIDDSPTLNDEELLVGPTWVHDQVAAGVRIIKSGQFDAVECGSCRFCPFQVSCPAMQGKPKAGRQR